MLRVCSCSKAVCNHWFVPTALQSTLEEVTQADLLLHVLDASSPYVLQQREAVMQVGLQLWPALQTCGVSSSPGTRLVEQEWAFATPCPSQPLVWLTYANSTGQAPACLCCRSAASLL